MSTNNKLPVTTATMVNAKRLFTLTEDDAALADASRESQPHEMRHTRRPTHVPFVFA
jgi:hypothetical protein